MTDKEKNDIVLRIVREVDIYGLGEDDARGAAYATFIAIECILDPKEVRECKN